MKHYRLGRIYCRCSARMALGKAIKVYEHTPDRLRCPNCNKNCTVFILTDEAKKIPKKIARKITMLADKLRKTQNEGKKNA